jgi:hypothetical protein
MNSATPGSKSARAGRNALLPHRLPGPMSDRFIRAMLRAATAAKLLDGWQGPHLAERTYCIAPRHAAAMERPLDYVIGYCELLAAAGVEPLYRESEPLF